MIRVNVYGMIQSVLPDYLRIRKSRESGGGRNEPSKSFGLEVPANVFIYSVQSKAPTTFFTSLKIKDVAAFEQTIAPYLKQAVVNNANRAFTLLINGDKRLSIAYNKKLAAIGYSPNAEDVADILTDLMLRRNVVTVAQSRFKELGATSDHIIYQQGADKATMKFRQGDIAVEGEFLLAGISVAKQVQHPQFSRESILSAWLNADIGRLLRHRVFTPGTYAIQADSFFKYYQGAASLELNGFTTQQEKIISYSYDDNFKKQEKTELRETSVPGVHLSIMAAPMLMDYLIRQGIINRDSGTVSRAFFPLCQLYAQSVTDGLLISATKAPRKAAAVITDTSFAGLTINFDLLEKQQELQDLKMLKRLSATATAGKNNRMIIRLHLLFDDAHRNALSQLMESL